MSEESGFIFTVGQFPSLEQKNNLDFCSRLILLGLLETSMDIFAGK